jgi:hypothetical protein
MPDSATARALVLEEPRRLAVREFPLPVVGDDDTLVLGPGIRGLCVAAASKEAGAAFVSPGGGRGAHIVLCAVVWAAVGTEPGDQGRRVRTAQRRAETCRCRTRG